MKRIVVGIMGAGLLVGILGWFLYWSNQPSSVSIASQEAAVQGLATEVMPFDAQEFSTQITADFMVKNRTNNSAGPISGQYLLVEKDPRTNAQVAITVTAGSGGVDDMSAVKLRLQNGADYTETTLDDAVPAGGRVFIKNSSYEKGIYWAENGKQVSVVASGGAENQAALEQALKTILINWQWK